MCVCEVLFQLATGGNCKSSKRHQSCIQLFLEAFSLFLVFSVETNQTLHLNVSYSKQKKHFGSEIRLPFSIWSDHLSFFYCLSCLFQGQVFEAIEHILRSCSGWKIPKHVDMLNMVIEFNREQK